MSVKKTRLENTRPQSTTFFAVANVRSWLHPEVRAVAMEVRFQAASGHFAAP